MILTMRGAECSLTALVVMIEGGEGIEGEGKVTAGGGGGGGGGSGRP